MNDLKKLEAEFNDKNLFKLSLTHKSWINENKDEGTNERLEFLGDAILEYVVSEELFLSFPQKEEGYLTALRANLVNTKNLATSAKKLGLGEMILLSKGEEETGGRNNPSLLADSLEAVIGAVYLDLGLKKVKAFVKENILKDIKEKLEAPLKDAKSRLQEHVQALGKAAPKYEVVSEKGPDHDKLFTIKVSVEGLGWGRGKGSSKSEAAQAAAEDALKREG